MQVYCTNLNSCVYLCHRNIYRHNGKSDICFAPVFFAQGKSIRAICFVGRRNPTLPIAQVAESGMRDGIWTEASFKSIAGYDDFRQAVPLVRYEDIRADVMRMVAGEKNVLWRGVVRHFAQSSGTSDGKSKYIPISNESFPNAIIAADSTAWPIIWH